MELFFELERVGVILKLLKKRILMPVAQIEEIEWGSGKRRPLVWQPFQKDQLWGGRDVWCWFRFPVEIPENLAGKRVEIRFSIDRHRGWDNAGSQFLVYRDGEIVQGVDGNHRTVTLTPSAVGGEQFLIEVAAYGGSLIHYPEGEPPRLEMIAALCTRERREEQLYFDLLALYETAQLYEKDAPVRIQLEEQLKQAINLLDLRRVGSAEYDASLEDAIACMKDFYATQCHEKRELANCIGHTHIDVAWLWTLEQTEQKAIRSFSTVLELMREYPEYFFMSSQPQLYQYVKRLAPKVYEQIRRRVKEGRWEPEGAMWVEADCNLISGESLVRQIVYGKEFFRREFGKECSILWLPDVFGYSAALPQILKKSGISYFVTSKISWNEYNHMPYDTFLWQGIDGTEIFTQFINAAEMDSPKDSFFSTYNGQLRPSPLQRGWERYQQKRCNQETLVTFGFGDGGGGPTREMLEMNRRLCRGVPGCVQTVIRPVKEILDRICENTKGKLPKWVGELYLEYHRGTYTSMARNKRWNRKNEFMLETAERVSVLGEQLLGRPYPAKELHDGWEILLLNQFHDIIPGSSVKEVYEESKKQYETLERRRDQWITPVLDELGRQVQSKGILCYNPTSFERSECVEHNGQTVYLEHIPPLGYCVVQPTVLEQTMQIDERGMENEFFRLRWNEAGWLTEIYDKRVDRQVLQPGKPGNVMTAFEDRPVKYDAWDVMIYYQEKGWDLDAPADIKVTCNTAERVSVTFTKPFLSSVVTQTVSLYHGIPRIDFQTEIDWKESDLLLKVAFPVDVLSSRASYEIQYGAIERPTHWNTSWDTAKFEVCAHKWADLSEEGYGVALLNDCKYGYDIKDGLMRLTLLKCADYPNPEADRERHFFTYSLLPHEGRWQEGEVVRQAILLNQPVLTKDAAGGGILPDSYSQVTCSSGNVVVEAVKQAEEGEGTVIRCYEAHGRRTKAQLTVSGSYEKAWETDLEERPITEVDFAKNCLTAQWAPFEIKTFLLR